MAKSYQISLFRHTKKLYILRTQSVIVWSKVHFLEPVLISYAFFENLKRLFFIWNLRRFKNGSVTFLKLVWRSQNSDFLLKWKIVAIGNWPNFLKNWHQTYGNELSKTKILN